MSKKALRLTKYGFIRSAKDNFSDDGTYFFGYRLMGVRVSYTRQNYGEDEIFLSIKTWEDDKLQNIPRELTDRYNGFEMSKFNEEEFAKWVEELKVAIKEARA